MKKKTLALLLALSCALSATACSAQKEVTETTVVAKDAFAEESKEPETTVTSETVSEDETVAETESAKEPKSDAKKTSANMPSELSDDLYSFQVSINGTVYQFPMWYSDFENLGWTYDGDNTQTLTSNQYSLSEVWEKDGFSVYTQLANLSMNTVPYSKCMISEITFDDYHLEDCDWEIILPKGIQYGVSNADDIKAAYGEPTRDYDGDLYYNMTYEYDIYQEIDLYVYKETNTLDKIEIRNMIELEGADNSVDPTVPDVVKNYQAPSSLGDDYYSHNVELEGNLYTLPCPVSEFIANGFTINESNSDTEVGSDSHGWIELRYNNQTLRAMIYNYADYATVTENCFVTEVECNDYDAKFALTLPGNIKIGSSEDDVLKAIEGFNYEKELSESSSYSYTYYTIYHPDDRSYYSCYEIKIEDGVVVALAATHEVNPTEE
ncbi:MAG: hypothetical protein IJN54_06995 [Lachnospiraceae bacterium]|nr:hypothetical protein [Lachnospiraceae bacterium]